MDRKDLIEYSTLLPDAKEDYPFDDLETTVMRHTTNNKWFAFFFLLDKELCVNVKVNPYEVDILCETYRGITTGWHMNKRHWITIHVDSDVSNEEILRYINESYLLTASKKAKGMKTNG
ncbi:MAG: MmcQ/YjbR family DNA-binding protein [Longicatena sp.]